MRSFSRYALFHQSPEERRLKYWVAREYGKMPKIEAERFRDWNWYTLVGCLTINASRRGESEDNIEAIREICQIGFDIFKENNYKNDRERGRL